MEERTLYFDNFIGELCKRRDEILKLFEEIDERSGRREADILIIGGLSKRGWTKSNIDYAIKDLGVWEFEEKVEKIFKETVRDACPTCVISMMRVGADLAVKNFHLSLRTFLEKNACVNPKIYQKAFKELISHISKQVFERGFVSPTTKRKLEEIVEGAKSMCHQGLSEKDLIDCTVGVYHSKRGELP